MDRIVDDGTAKIKPSRYIAVIAPVIAGLLFLPNAFMEDLPVNTKISAALVWLPAMVSVYYNLKHAIIPDCDFGFIKAIKPYNILVLLLSFSELLCLTAWDYYAPVAMAFAAIAFGVLCILTVVFAKKGVEKWTV